MGDEVNNQGGEPQEAPQQQAPPQQQPAPAPQPAARQVPDDERVRRMVQSQVQREVHNILKAQAGVQERAAVVDGVLQRLTASGAIKDGANLDAVRGEILSEALAQGLAGRGEPKEDDKPEEQGDDTQSRDPITAEAYGLAQKYGLSQGDPELAEIVTNQGAFAYLSSIEAAGKKRQARAAGQPQGQAPEPTPGDAGVGGAPPKDNKIEKITDPDALLEMGLYGNK